MDRNTAAVFAYADVYSKAAGLTVHDVIRDFPLCRGQLVGAFVGRIKAVENVLDRAVCTHTAPPLGWSKGLRMPRRLLLLT